MIAGRNLTRYSGRVDVLLADRAVGPGHTLHTFVFSFQVVGEAHVTTVTVEVVTTTSDPANSTSCTMKLLFVFVIVKFAVVAEILSKLEAALDALLPDLLPLVALAALDPRDVVPLEGVLLLLVMAEPAPVQAVTAGSHKFAFSSVMLTRELCWFHFSMR